MNGQSVTITAPQGNNPQHGQQVSQQPQHPAVERRAQALAEVSQMQKDLIELHAVCQDLQRNFNREQDRCALLSRELDTYKHLARVYHGKMIELATAMANIGLLTGQAQEIMRTAQELADNGHNEQDHAEAALQQ